METINFYTYRMCRDKVKEKTKESLSSPFDTKTMDCKAWPSIFFFTTTPVKKNNQVTRNNEFYI